MNSSQNSISRPISLSRENTISKYPVEFTAQRDASTDTTAVHLRCMVGGSISENCTFVNTKAGRHTGWPTACGTLMSPMMPASSPAMHDRCIGLRRWRRPAAGLVAKVGESARWEFAMLRSLMGAPPRRGLEQHLRRKRPQEPGGCISSPMALRTAKLRHIIVCRPCRKTIISRPGIRYSHQPARRTKSGPTVGRNQKSLVSGGLGNQPEQRPGRETRYRFTATTNGLSLAPRLCTTSAFALALVLSLRARWGMSPGMMKASPGFTPAIPRPSTSTIRLPSSV
jgi:hypothetical protein